MDTTRCEFRVYGADKTTGEDRSIVVEAADEKEAERAAQQGGLMVSSAEPLIPASRPSTTAEEVRKGTQEAMDRDNYQILMAGLVIVAIISSVVIWPLIFVWPFVFWGMSKLDKKRKEARQSQNE